MALLDVSHLAKTFPIEGGFLHRRQGTVRALEDVSFSMLAGETLAVVGGSGCGKSTLAKILSGLLAPDSGDILWESNPWLAYSRQQRAHRVQMIFQDPYASLNPKLSIGTQLSEVLRLDSALPVEPRCMQLLSSVGLAADILTHYPFQFSGGQRQRIAIARALAMNPRLLIADEPLSALDVTTQAQILDLLKELKASCGLTILFITHDLAVAAQFADRVLVLQNGKVVEEGSTGVVLGAPQQPYTQALVNAVPQIP